MTSKDDVIQELLEYLMKFDDSRPERRAEVLKCLLNLLSYEPFEFHLISDDKLELLWLCLLRDINDLKVASPAISIMNKLICSDLCNNIFFVNLVDVLFAFVTYFNEETEEVIDVKDKNLVLQSVKSCLDKVTCLIAPPMSSKQLSKCSSFTFLRFAYRAVNLILTHPQDDWTLLRFIVNVIQGLKTKRNLGQFADLPLKCKQLLEYLLVNCHKLVDSGHVRSVFSFLIKVDGVDETTLVVNDLLDKALLESKARYTCVRQTLITCLSPLPNATALLGKVVPNDTEVLQIFDNLKSGIFDPNALPSALTIVSNLAEYYKGDNISLLSLLSLPWICDIGSTEWSNFSKSLPLLTPVKQKEKELKGILSTPLLKSNLLKALSRIPEKNEWRTLIFKESLKSPFNDVQIAALEALPFFCLSIPTFSFVDALSPILEHLSMANLNGHSISLLESLIKAFSYCLCIAGKEFTMSSNDQISCKHCHSQKGSRTSVNLQLPHTLTSVFARVIEMEEECHELKINLIGLLCSIVRHVNTTDEFREELIHISLPLLSTGGGTSAAYIDFVEAFVQLDIGNLGIELCKRILDLEDESLKVDYFIRWARFAKDNDVSLNCVTEVLSVATVSIQKQPKIVTKAQAMINVISEQNEIKPKVYFLRNASVLCARTVKRLLEQIESLLLDQNCLLEEINKRVDVVLENYFYYMAVIFSFMKSKDKDEQMREWLQHASYFLFGPLILYKSSQHGAFQRILDKISEITKIQGVDLVARSLPKIFWYLSCVKNLKWNDGIMKRIDQCCPCNTLYAMIKKCYFQCMVNIIFGLGQNFETCQEYLMKLFAINNEPKSQTFSYDNCVKPHYLGLLLDFRRAFTDVTYFNYRHVIVKSLNILLTEMSPEIVSMASSRVLDVLKAVSSPEPSVEVWLTFVQRLVPAIQEEMLHHILIAFAPWSDQPGSNRVFEYIFTARNNISKNLPCDRFDRVVFVLYNQNSKFLKNGYIHEPKELWLQSCAKVLAEEPADIQALALPKLLNALNTEKIETEILGQLIHSLMHALKTSKNQHTLSLIGICLGKIGAIDPGKIGMAALGDNSKQYDRRPKPLRFVDSWKLFLREILETCCRLLMECNEVSNVDFVGMALQDVLLQFRSPDLVGFLKEVFMMLSPEVYREVVPYKTTIFKFSHTYELDLDSKPYIDYANDYRDWLWRWYRSACDKLRTPIYYRIFNAMFYVYYTNDSQLPQIFIPQLILQAILEENLTIMTEAQDEMVAVFRKALTCDGWYRFAAQTCFYVLEVVEKYSVSTHENNSGERKAGVRKDKIQKFLHKVLIEKDDDIGLVSVAVAEKYNSSCRALRWLEQYGMKILPSGKLEFDRQAMYTLEKVYIQLGDTDGVLGAFDTIENNTTPVPHERVVAFEATGEYTEAMPLYQLEPIQKAPLVKCILRLNQPLIAFYVAANFVSQELDPKLKHKLRDYQLEAAYRVGDSKSVDEILKINAENSVTVTSWGAHVASILAEIKNRSQCAFETNINRARMQLMDSLKAVIMEDEDTYSQAYRYIQRLHILFEIEDTVDTLKLFNPAASQSCDILVDRWKERQNNAIQCSSILEPIFWVRRELLQLVNTGKNKTKICSSYMESCKLSRQAGHLSTAWAHLVNARSLGVKKDHAVDLEEARFRFQKGLKNEAIFCLQKSLEKHFPQLFEPISKFSANKSDDVPRIAKEVMAKAKNKDCIDFAKAQLELTTFMEKTKTANITDIYLRYRYIDELNNNDETQAYRFAVFYDNCYYGRNVQDVDNVLRCLQLYSRVLTLGKRHVLHIMPRMLTVWLDFTASKDGGKQEKHPPAKKRRTAPSESPDILKVNSFIDKKIETLDSYYFLLAFPQLISRLCHPVESVYQVLAHMISYVILNHPHECLWQAIASYRSDDKTDPLRAKRMKEIFGIVIAKGNPKLDFKKRMDEYEQFAKYMIEIAEYGDKTLKSGEYHDFNTRWAALNRYIRGGRKIAVPFITTVEKAMPSFEASQISVPNIPQEEEMVYISAFEDDYRVFSSLEKPKLITIIGSNGNKYHLIVKKNDELRKDARVLDFCRMVNTLLLNDPEALRRQLRIRTYSALPLQSRGGIIEWLPNLTHLRACVTVGQSHSIDSHYSKKWHEHKTNPAKLRDLFDEFVAKTPVQMANWLRSNFVDPCKWYGARMAYTRTAATMSMVGFILGLGDRHLENILIDHTNGDIVHVDYNVIFNKGEDLPAPEKVPFRLTRNMIDGFGPTGVEGAFRKCCEVVMRVLREEQAMLCTVLQTFVHDPLLEWSKFENRNQQMRGNAKSTATTDKNDENQEISLIKSRLEGSIVTRKMYPPGKSVISMSVQGQVAQLIKMATEPSTLAEMYVGWNPHL